MWPEMLHALRDAGWRNYSLFLDDDGTLIGYFETESLVNALEKMGKTDVTSRWQAQMSDFFVGIDSTPDQSFAPLTEVFNLEAQLALAPAPTHSNPTEEPQ